MDVGRSRVLITGGAGFIGSHLADALVERGCDVIVLDNFASGRPANLADASRHGKVTLIEGSILDRPAVAAAMTGCTYVFHLAVECVRRSLGAPLDNHATNATGTLYVLEAARAANVTRFVYCSSSEVYGNCGGDRLVESAAVCAPVTVYGAAKLAGEHYTLAYAQTYGLAATVVRPFNAYGPREHERGDLAEVIPRFIIRALNGLPPIIFGTGQNGRDFTYVTDIARGIVAAAECDAARGHVTNLAYGRMITISEVAQAVTVACGRPELQAVHIGERPGDVHTLQADISLARELFGYRAEIGFAAGLDRYLTWFRDHHDDVSNLLEADPINWQMPAAGAASRPAPRH